MKSIFMQMIGEEWLGIEAGWEEVKNTHSRVSVKEVSLFLQLFYACILER